VIRELDDTKETDKREKMKALVADYGVTVIPAGDEVKRLSDVYISAGVIQEKYSPDAVHIAAATIAGMDFIVSLNFKHIVKHKTIIETEIINTRGGNRQ
jgi:hypothetical protein